jgi:hypothetical protein
LNRCRIVETDSRIFRIKKNPEKGLVIFRMIWETIVLPKVISIKDEVGVTKNSLSLSLLLLFNVELPVWGSGDLQIAEPRS